MDKPVSNRKKKRDKGRKFLHPFTPEWYARKKTSKSLFRRRQRKLIKKGYVFLTQVAAVALENRGVRIVVVANTEGLSPLKYAPKWAVELVDHPEFDTVMVLRALREMEYRKEVVMECRLLRRGAHHA